MPCGTEICGWWLEATPPMGGGVCGSTILFMGAGAVAEGWGMTPWRLACTGGSAGSGGVSVGLVLLLLLDAADLMEECDIIAEASSFYKIGFMNLSRCSSSYCSTGLNNCVYAIPNPQFLMNNP